jgi:DNA-binding XRE family transcriptional regulator
MPVFYYKKTGSIGVSKKKSIKGMMKMLLISTHIGKRIAFLRKRQGLRQKDLANMAGIRCPRLSNIETGRNRPSISALVSIATALGLTLNQLIGNRENKLP